MNKRKMNKSTRKKGSFHAASLCQLFKYFHIVIVVVVAVALYKQRKHKNSIKVSSDRFLLSPSLPPSLAHSVALPLTLAGFLFNGSIPVNDASCGFCFISFCLVFGHSQWAQEWEWEWHTHTHTEPKFD